MKKVRITISGCDDDTVLIKPLTQPQIDFLQQIAVEINVNSESGCQPKMKVDEEPNNEPK